MSCSVLKNTDTNVMVDCLSRKPKKSLRTREAIAETEIDNYNGVEFYRSVGQHRTVVI